MSIVGWDGTFGEQRGADLLLLLLLLLLLWLWLCTESPTPCGIVDSGLNRR